MTPNANRPSGGPAVGRSPAKLILMGEHFVVYSTHALAIPVPALTLEASLTLKTSKTSRAPSTTLSSDGCSPSLDRPRPGEEFIDTRSHLEACLDLACRRYGLNRSDLDVGINSCIPIGAGLGSSAALSVAVARAAAELAGITDPSELEPSVREVSLEAERLAHGRPSGIDTEVCLTGRALLFARGKTPETLNLDRADRVGLVIIDTGISAGTAEMVALAARYKDRSPGRFDALMKETEQAVLKTADALMDAKVRALGQLMDQQHRRLVEIGVSSPELESAADAARAAGAAGAKLSGSGGGGVAVAVCDPANLTSIADQLSAQGHIVAAATQL